MSSPTTEQVIYKYITANPITRQYWQDLVRELRDKGLDNDAVITALTEKIMNKPWREKDAWADILDHVHRTKLAHADLGVLAYKLASGGR